MKPKQVKQVNWFNRMHTRLEMFLHIKIIVDKSVYMLADSLLKLYWTIVNVLTGVCKH